MDFIKLLNKTTKEESRRKAFESKQQQSAAEGGVPFKKKRMPPIPAMPPPSDSDSDDQSKKVEKPPEPKPAEKRILRKKRQVIKPKVPLMPTASQRMLAREQFMLLKADQKKALEVEKKSFEQLVQEAQEQNLKKLEKEKSGQDKGGVVVLSDEDDDDEPILQVDDSTGKKKPTADRMNQLLTEDQEGGFDETEGEPGNGPSPKGGSQDKTSQARKRVVTQFTSQGVHQPSNVSQNVEFCTNPNDPSGPPEDVDGAVDDGKLDNLEIPTLEEQRKQTNEEQQKQQQQERKPGKISRTFNEVDDIYNLTQSFESTFVWLMKNKIIAVMPNCKKCRIPFKLIKSRNFMYDFRGFQCPVCEGTRSIREGSFLSEFNLTIMEIVRIIFFYYARRFDVETVWREIASMKLIDGGRFQAKQMVMGLNQFTRQVISERIVRDLKKKKLGGVGKDVYMDSYKLNLKTRSNVEAFWIVGFIDNETQRARAYLTHDVRIDTLATFIAKTVALHSTLKTPFYRKVGWDWLNKFYDHQRLVRDHLKKKKTQGARARRDELTGFEYMWQEIKELELIFMKMGEKTRRLKKIKTHLQGYLDEMVWRIENRTVETKRQFLIRILGTYNWKKYLKRLKAIQKKKEERQVENNMPRNIAEEMMEDINEGYERLKEKQAEAESDEEEDQIEERRKIFGDEEPKEEKWKGGFENDENVEVNPEDNPSQGGHSEKSSDVSSEMSDLEAEMISENQIIQYARRERLRQENEQRRPIIRDCMSQAVWKFRRNLIKRTNPTIDDRDRIDLFDENAAEQEPSKKKKIENQPSLLANPETMGSDQQGKFGFETDSDDSDCVQVLEYD